MYSAIKYQTDSGLYVGYSVALYIGYNDNYGLQNIIADELIPPVLLPEIQWFSKNLCFTRQIFPRFVVLNLLSGDTLKIAYPFCPGTDKWFAFFEQLQSPNIAFIQKFGEKTTDKFLRNNLGVL